MSRKLIVKGRSEDIALMRACYRLFFSEWEVENFPDWLNDMEEDAGRGMISFNSTRRSSAQSKAGMEYETVSGSC